jgi:2'-5' RNA ligase
MSMSDSERIRSFLAIELTEGLRDSLEALRKKVDSPAFDVRWVRPENVHLTLRFFGEVSQEELARISQAALHAAEQAEPFPMVLAGLGAFPARGSARVVWVGVKDPEPLLSLENRLSQGLERANWPPPDKPFRPHLTLGRLKSQRGQGTLRKVLEENREVAVGQMRVEHLTLIQSELRPAGPIYTTLDRFRFPNPPGKKGS